MARRAPETTNKKQKNKNGVHSDIGAMRPFARAHVVTVSNCAQLGTLRHWHDGHLKIDPRTQGERSDFGATDPW